jgi:hypothetical protein
VAISVEGAGAASANQAAITPAFHASSAAGDIMIGVGESVGNEAYVVPTGWAHVLGSPVNIDTTTRLTVIWRRFVGGDTAPSWGDSGNHNIGRILTVRGCVTTGNPWDVTPTVSPDATLNVTATWPAVTTVTDECLILFIIATGRDLGTTANLGALTGGTGLTSITERMDDWSALGTGGGFGMVSAVKATAGSTGAPTATMGTNEPRAMMTLPLRPEPSVAATLPILVTPT